MPRARHFPKQCVFLYIATAAAAAAAETTEAATATARLTADPAPPPCQAQGPGRGRSTTRSRTASRSGRPSGSANTAHWRGRPTTRAPRCGLRHEAGHGATPLYRPAGSLRCSPRAQPSETAESKYSSPTLLLHQEERPLPPDGPEACLTPSETEERHVVLGYLPTLNEYAGILNTTPLCGSLLPRTPSDQPGPNGASWHFPPPSGALGSAGAVAALVGISLLPRTPSDQPGPNGAGWHFPPPSDALGLAGAAAALVGISLLPRTPWL